MAGVRGRSVGPVRRGGGGVTVLRPDVVTELRILALSSLSDDKLAERLIGIAEPLVDVEPLDLAQWVIAYRRLRYSVQRYSVG